MRWGLERLLQCRQQGIGVHRLLHRFRHTVDPVPDGRKVAAELFHEGDELCDLLLGQQIDLEIELSALFRMAGLSVLGDQNGGSHQKGSEAHGPLKPRERWRIERLSSEARRQEIRADPEGGETQKQIEGAWPTDLSRDPLDAPLVFTDIAFDTRLQCSQRCDVLLVVFRSDLPFRTDCPAHAVPTESGCGWKGSPRGKRPVAGPCGTQTPQVVAPWI